MRECVEKIHYLVWKMQEQEEENTKSQAGLFTNLP